MDGRSYYDLEIHELTLRLREVSVFLGDHGAYVILRKGRVTSPASDSSILKIDTHPHSKFNPKQTSTSH